MADDNGSGGEWLSEYNEAMKTISERKEAVRRSEVKIQVSTHLDRDIKPMPIGFSAQEYQLLRGAIGDADRWKGTLAAEDHPDHDAYIQECRAVLRRFSPHRRIKLEQPTAAAEGHMSAEDYVKGCLAVLPKGTPDERAAAMLKEMAAMCVGKFGAQ